MQGSRERQSKRDTCLCVVAMDRVPLFPVNNHKKVYFIFCQANFRATRRNDLRTGRHNKVVRKRQQ